MKFIRRANSSGYVADQTITIGAGGGSDTVTDIPVVHDTAIEVELDDGSVVVLLGYIRK